MPSFMDPNGNYGELVILKMEPVNGNMPDHPFTLRQSIERRVNGKIEGAIPEEGGRTYALKVRSRHHLEKLLSMTHLSDGTAVKVSHHPGLNSVRCVISCRDLKKVKEEDEILNCLKDQKVTGVRRITRKVGENKEPTPTVILTISGTTRPEHIDIGYQRIRTRPYYPAPMLCFRCYQFGHTRQKCKQESDTCGNCGQQHEIVKDVRCLSPAYCTRCEDNSHSLGSRKCPVYVKEDNIQHIRVDRGISYPEARRMFEASTGTRSYAGATIYSKDQAISELSAKIEALTSQMAAKDARIKSLEEKQSADPPTNSSEFQRLEKLILNMQAEIKQKDARILALENALERGSRMDLVRKHGTIEDLVAKVSALETTLNLKDKEIHTLRSVNKALLTPTDHKSTQNNESKSSKSQQKHSKNEQSLAPSTNVKKPGQAVPAPISKNPPVTPQSSMEVGKEKNKKTTETGTKPKHKKPLTTQNSEEREAKRTKPDNSVMYISDTEVSPTQEGDSMNDTAMVCDDSISSDEPTPGDEEAEMLP